MAGVAPPANPPPTSGVPPTRMSPQEMRSFEAEHGVTSEAHQKFYHALETLSGESPLLLASFISKYARKIQETDPATSIKLLQIVKRIKG
jgi:hypothetical protein